MGKSFLINFLSWNIHKKNLIPRIVNLVDTHDIDIILLLENSTNISSLLLELNKNSKGKIFYQSMPILDLNKNRITLISRFNNTELIPILDSEKIAIRKLKIQGYKEILISLVHFISKQNMSSDSQFSEAIKHLNYILDNEKSVKHDRTVVFGDFNMNPFEKGMVSADSFNAVISRNIAKKESRVVQGKNYKYFYNPMWHFFGDIDPTPIGTYHYNSSDHINYSWNIFDQVLIRPSLIDAFQEKKIKILDSDGKTSLLNKNSLPDTKSGSDHLPIIFSLDLGAIK